MFNGDDKKSIGLISKNNNFERACSKLFCTLLCRFFARPQRETF